MHAARHHGARVVGVALSREQVDEATRRVRQAGLGRTGWRSACRTTATCAARQFDAISSIGMFEHVGTARMARYFETLR